MGNEQKKLSPIHPGEILSEEFLLPMNITQYRLAKAIGVDARRIHSIVHGERSITRKRPSCFRASSETLPGSGWGCKANTTWRSPRTAFTKG